MLGGVGGGTGEQVDMEQVRHVVPDQDISDEVLNLTRLRNYFRIGSSGDRRSGAGSQELYCFLLSGDEGLEVEEKGVLPLFSHFLQRSE